MAVQGSDRGDVARLVEVTVVGRTDAWVAAGFTVDGDAVVLGATTLRLTGGGPDDGEPGGICSWTIAGIQIDGHDLDGLPTRTVDRDDPTATSAGAGDAGHGDRNSQAVSEPTSRASPLPMKAPTPPGWASPHPNGCVGLDHIVVLTPALDRTIAAMERADLACRRIRDTTSQGTPMRQAFFRLGPTVLEVVSGDVGDGRPATDGPSRWFGLAVDVDDLDVTNALLGDRLGTIKPAVQAGRRIVTFRRRDLGLTVALAAMDHHGDR